MVLQRLLKTEKSYGYHGERRKSVVSLALNDQSRIDKISCIMPELDRQTEVLIDRVIAEYFNMVDEFLLIADQKLFLLTNNYSHSLLKSVIRPIRNRLLVKNLQISSSGDNLDSLFTKYCAEPLYCTDDTILNLISLYAVFDYSSAKSDTREHFKKKKIDKILQVLDKLNRRSRLESSPTRVDPILGLIRESKTIMGSVKGIDYRSKIKSVNLL